MNAHGTRLSGGRASFTATAVAAARGVAGVDDVAEALVPDAFARTIRASRKDPRLARALDLMTLGLVEYAELRTLAIDAALERAFASGEHGETSLVVLGAGLDARAWRLEVLRGSIVFEVDHPATQAFKRARLADATVSQKARDVRFVAVDFEKDALDVELARVGQTASTKSFWIWEGVTVYLNRAAILASLDVIGARSAPGSRIAVTYATPETTRFFGPMARIALSGFRVLGEPVRGTLSTRELESELSRVGFDVEDDTSPADWRARHRPSAPSRVTPWRERLAVAVKR